MSWVGSVCYKEFSREYKIGDIPYYPIRLLEEKKLLQDYVAKAHNFNLNKKPGSPGVSFIGRLGTYRYLDMDVTIHEALKAASEYLDKIKNADIVPAFFEDPL